MTSPDMVTPGSAALSVAPSTTIMEEWALMSKPSIVMSDGDWDVIDIEIVLEPMTKVPEGWREMRVLFMVAAVPPAEIVVPAIENAEGFGVNV